MLLLIGFPGLSTENHQVQDVLAQHVHQDYVLSVARQDICNGNVLTGISQLDCTVQSQELHSSQANSSLKRQNRGTAGATYLHAKVDKHTCDYLLDTDSEVTIFPASVVEDEVVKPSNHKLAAANGTEIAALGEVTLPISVGD